MIQLIPPHIARDLDQDRHKVYPDAKQANVGDIDAPNLVGMAAVNLCHSYSGNLPDILLQISKKKGIINLVHTFYYRIVEKWSIDLRR